MYKILGVLIMLTMGSVYAAQYKVDPKHSSLVWQVDHFGFTKTSGKWMLNGTLEYDPQSPQNSTANITIDLGTILTGIADLDAHLKGKQFFEVDKFPTSTFVSKKVTVHHHDITEVSGDLTLHGITRPITFKVKQNKVAKDPIFDRPTVGFSGETTLKRSDFGILTLLPNVGDEVRLNVEVEAYENNKDTH